MKAVVAQIAGRHAVLLTENGVFLKVKNQRYRIGQQITFCEKRKLPEKMLAMAAGLAVFLLGGTFLAMERLPYSYVSVDVNPSVEYSLNWFDRVLSLRAVNEDARPIVQSLEKSGALNQPIAKAVGMTIQELNDRQYFKDGSENDVVISVSSFGLKDVNGLPGTLKNSAISAISNHILEVTSFQTDPETIREAQKYHTTAGKLVIVENLAGSGDSLAAEAKEEWLKKPVREILNHNNGNTSMGNEKKLQEPGYTLDTMITAGILPKDTGSSLTNLPGDTKVPKVSDTLKETKTPRRTYAPAKTPVKPNTQTVGQTDATPASGAIDKPDNTQAPKEKDHEPQATSPDKGSSGGQGKENEPQEGEKAPEQPPKGGGNPKQKP